jgi:hypothetical protein
LLSFVIVLFGIVALQFFQSKLRNHCFDLQAGECLGGDCSDPGSLCKGDGGLRSLCPRHSAFAHSPRPSTRHSPLTRLLFFRHHPPTRRRTTQMSTRQTNSEAKSAVGSAQKTRCMCTLPITLKAWPRTLPSAH